jgi:hypothetical protein
MTNDMSQVLQALLWASNVQMHKTHQAFDFLVPPLDI